MPDTIRPASGSTRPLPPVVSTPVPQRTPARLSVVTDYLGIQTRRLTQQVTMQLVRPGFTVAPLSGLRVVIGHPYPGAAEQGVAGNLQQPFGLIDRTALDATLRAQGAGRGVPR